MKVLIADDDRDMVDVLGYWLRAQGHEVNQVYNGEAALEAWEQQQPQLILLDVNMPVINGFEVCARMRSTSPGIVLMFTSCWGREDEIRGLEVGADDYIRKPFSPRQLLARIKAITRRVVATGQLALNTPTQVGCHTFDPSRHELLQEGIVTHLTPIETKLLQLLITYAGQCLSSSAIIEKLWSSSEDADANLVKTHMRHLRQKIEPDPNDPTFIVTVRGVGYTYYPAGQKK